MNLTRFVLTTTAAAFLLGAPAMAASVAFGSVEYSLELVGTASDDTTIEFLDPFSVGEDSSTGAGSSEFSSTGTAASGNISASAAAPFLGTGSASASYESVVFIEDSSFDVVTLMFRLTYSLFASATTDSLFSEDANSVSSLVLLVGGQEFLSEEVSRNISNLGEGELSGVFDFNVSVDGFQDISVFAETDAFASSDVGVIPLPASALLLLTGLGGIAIARRRQS